MRKQKLAKQRNIAYMTRVYMIILAVLFIAFVFRFGQLMIFKQANGQDLTKLVHELYNTDEVITARRGTIYDIAGEPLAVDTRTYSLYAVLTDKFSGVQPVESKKDVARALAKHIKMDEDAVLKVLNQEDVNQVEFGNAGKNLSYAVKEAIEKEEIKGVYFTETISRDYPKGYFANSIIGLAQAKKEDTTGANPLVGIMGLEQQYNIQLTGIDGKLNYDKDFYGYRVSGTEKVVEAVQNGNNIYTTLDSKLNTYLEEVVSKIYEDYKPESLTAMLVRPKTGNVIAAAQRPTFNVKESVFPENGWVNRFAETTFEPGSTFKLFLLAAAINEGIYSPMDIYRSGSVQVGSITIRDWNGEGWGDITYLEGFALSSNVAFVKIASKLGFDKWKEYIDAFGFGKSTESGFANEASGLNYYQAEEAKASTSFGQAISVTNLQMIQAFTAIANKGQMQKLRFVDRIENAQTKEVTYLPVEQKNTPITADTAKWVLKYMEEVVYAERGTGKDYDIPNVRIAVKTGTAQVFDDKTKSYLPSEWANYLYSAVGFVPSENPEYIIYITMDRPPGKTATDGVSKLFVQFMTYANKYISTQTDETVQGSAIIPSAIGADISEAKSYLANQGFKDVVVIGDGTAVAKQMPVDNLTYALDTKILLYTGGSAQLPNMIGWSKSDVIKLANLLDLSITLDGEGYAAEQSVSPGEDISTMGQLSVKFVVPKERQMNSTTTTDKQKTSTTQSSSTTSQR